MYIVFYALAHQRITALILSFLCAFHSFRTHIPYSSAVSFLWLLLLVSLVKKAASLRTFLLRSSVVVLVEPPK